MAAFSSTPFQHHHPFLLESVFLQNSPTNNDAHNKSVMTAALLHQLPNYTFTQQNLIQNLDHNTNTNKNSMDNSFSVVTDKHDSSERDSLTPINKKRKCKEAFSSSNSTLSKDKREVKGRKQKKVKNNEEKKDSSKEENKAEEGGYIHVRARRGQATDSHSLAERVRRERISERMKLLQAIVPGCDKVTGKALMLDEIINYVQSLQNQVEFLSMKLASMNPVLYDFGVDLESFMVRSDQDLSELPSPMSSMQECSPTTANNYNFVDNPANPILFQQFQFQTQGSRQTLWEVEDHRQKIINQSGFNSNLFSLH